MTIVPDAARQRWDSYVAEQPLGNFHQSWGWGQLHRRYGWSVLRLAAVREPGSQWVGAIQIR